MENISTSAAVKLYQHNHYIHAPRQLGEGPLQQSVQNGLPTSTSSFDYWWPYPAWTATAATSIASQVLSSPPFPVPMTTQDGGIGMPLSAPPDVNSSTFPSSTSDASTSIPSTSSTSLTSSASSASSTSPTSTSASLSHHFNFHNFIANPRNLIPLLASVLGAILLFILFWFLCKRYSCRRYRSQNRNRNRDSYHYPSEGQGWRAVHAEKRSWWGGLFGAHDEPEDVITGPKYVGIEDPDAEKDSLMDDEQLGLGLDEEQDVTSGFEDDIDQDPFTPSKPKRARTRRSDRPKSSRNRSRASSSAARSLLPPTYLHQDSFEFAGDDDGSDKEGEDDFYNEEPDKSQLRVPWESLRHKSIKRAILAKVDEEKRWTDSMRGLRAAKAVGAALSLGSRSGGASVEKRGTVTHHNGRSRSTRMARSQRRRSERQQEQGEVGRGFRIVMESPPPQLPTPGSAGDGNGKAPWSLASAFPFQLFSNESQQEEKTSRKEDPYTPVPTRMRSGSRSCGSSRAGSPATSPTKRSQATRPPMYASSSPSVLRMRSPPSVMTPQMESALCFTPVVGSSARMGGGPGLEGINSPRGRPIKARSAKRTEKAMELMEPEPGTIYTKTYRDRTDRAMKRVEAIVESGWNERGRVGHY